LSIHRLEESLDSQQQRVKNVLIQLDSRDTRIAHLDGEIVSLKKQNDAKIDSVLEDEVCFVLVFIYTKKKKM